MLKSGVVEVVSSRDTKFGAVNVTMWAIKVDNVFYGTKKVEPKCKKGDHISFEASQNEKGYWDADPKTIKLVAPEPVASAPAPNKQPTVVSTATKTWVPDADRQNSITYQSARKDALELVGLLLSKDLVDFGKGKGADKIALVETFVDRYTVRFYEDTRRLAPPETLESAGVVKSAPKAKVEEEKDDFEDDLPDMFS